MYAYVCECAKSVTAESISMAAAVLLLLPVAMSGEGGAPPGETQSIECAHTDMEEMW